MELSLNIDFERKTRNLEPETLNPRPKPETRKKVRPEKYFMRTIQSIFGFAQFQIYDKIVVIKPVFYIPHIMIHEPSAYKIVLPLEKT